MLELVGVSRRYGVGPTAVVALDGVDLRVDAGEMVAVMGPSGSGKTTLLSVAGALDRASAGTVRVAGRALDDLDASSLAELRRREIGFVFQDFNLLAALTAVENVAVPLELDGMAAPAARAESLRQLRAVGLEERCDAFPDDLSGGECQRVAIARALVGDRRLVLADEPTGALDSESSSTVMRLLREVAGTSRAVVLVTHDPEAARWADRVVMVRDGRLVESVRT
ncbi:MAG: ABC transporter ATP-binding protein [Acidimicrobiales bacterium]|nr:ABC transporter ATP-binding protein [Acidimicrobiales bacterium]